MKKQPKPDECWSHKHDYPIEEIWGTCNTLARLIAPRLRAFEALDKHGCPSEMGDVRHWNQAIGKMAKAFELLGLDYYPSDEDNQAIAEGLELFHKYFRKLWD